MFTLMNVNLISFLNIFADVGGLQIVPRNLCYVFPGFYLIINVWGQS